MALTIIIGFLNEYKSHEKFTIQKTRKQNYVSEFNHKEPFIVSR